MYREMLLYVAPLAGAWIEITEITKVLPQSTSLPSRERGLKYHRLLDLLALQNVAPLAGAWIEIAVYWLYPSSLWSLPSRERGLK